MKQNQSGLKSAHSPMGEERFRQLMRELSASFAEADGGKEERARIKERERQHDAFLAERTEVIKNIMATMGLYGISVEDLE